HHRRRNCLERNRASIRDGYQLAAFFALLLAMATLDISRVDDIWITTQNLPVVDVAQRPILIALVLERLQRAWRIVRVLGSAGQIGMQHADIEPMWNSGRITCRQIFGDLRSGEALTVKGNFQGLDAEGLRLVGFENVDVRRWPKLLDQLARRVVVPIKKIDIDSRILEPHH